MLRILNLRGGLGNQAIQISYMEDKYGSKFVINDPNDILHVSLRTNRQTMKSHILWYITAGIRRVVKKRNWPGAFEFFCLVDGYCQDEVNFYSHKVLEDLKAHFASNVENMRADCVIHARIGDYQTKKASNLYVSFRVLWPNIKSILAREKLDNPVFISQETQSEIEGLIGKQSYNIKKTSSLIDDVSIALNARVFIASNSTLSLLISELRWELGRKCFVPGSWYVRDIYTAPVLASKHNKY